jgi:hypothetical protein
MLTLSLAGKLLITLALLGVMATSALLRPPRHLVDRSLVVRLISVGLATYLVGISANVTHRPTLAAISYASGVVVCSLTVWLSRGADPGVHETEADPLEPDGPQFDWDAFERELSDYARSTPV